MNPVFGSVDGKPIGLPLIVDSVPSRSGVESWISGRDGAVTSMMRAEIPGIAAAALMLSNRTGIDPMLRSDGGITDRIRLHFQQMIVSNPELGKTHQDLKGRLRYFGALASMTEGRSAAILVSEVIGIVSGLPGYSAGSMADGLRTPYSSGKANHPVKNTRKPEY